MIVLTLKKKGKNIIMFYIKNEKKKVIFFLSFSLLHRKSISCTKNKLHQTYSSVCTCKMEEKLSCKIKMQNVPGHLPN